MKIKTGTIIQYKDSFGTHYGIVEKDKGSKVHTWELSKNSNGWVKTLMNRDIPKSDILNKSVDKVQFGKIVGEAKERDYKKEYEQYHSKPEQRKNRSERNKARRKKKLEVGDPREVDHKKPLSKGGSNSDSNLRVVSRETNRKKGAKNEMRNVIKRIIKEELSKLDEGKKIRYDVYLFKGDSREPFDEPIIQATSLADYQKQVVALAKKSKADYVEVEHMGMNIASYSKKNGYKFERGSDFMNFMKKYGPALQ